MVDVWSIEGRGMVDLGPFGHDPGKIWGWNIRQDMKFNVRATQLTKKTNL